MKATTEMYAAKWRADGHTEEPTDEALREAFAHCVRPARADEYPAIREAMAEPTQHCTTCGTGPFFYVEAREFPTLCIDHSDEASRERHGWTPENSRD